MKKKRPGIKKVEIEIVGKNEKGGLSVTVEELEKIKKSLDLKIEGKEKELEDLKLKSDKIDGVLTALKEIKKDIHFTGKEEKCLKK